MLDGATTKNASPESDRPAHRPARVYRLRRARGTRRHGARDELEARDPALISRSRSNRTALPLSLAMASDALKACGLTNIAADHLLEVMDLPARGVIDFLPGAQEFLQKVKSLGLRTVVFSNATFRSSAGYRRDFRSSSVSEFIDEVVASVDLGFRKSSAEMFEAALHAARCRPSECAVVGDSTEKDILPAIGRGMRAIREDEQARSGEGGIFIVLPQANVALECVPQSQQHVMPRVRVLR